MLNKTLLYSLTLTIILALLALMLYWGLIRFNYPSYEQFPVRGIDISHHQGDIDWKRLDKSQVQFAYIKASEGATFTDNKFVTNWRAAKANHIAAGAYHFYSLCVPAKRQAAHFIATASSTKSTGLAPAIDLEFGGNCKRRVPRKEFQRDLRAFLLEVENAWGCQAVIYLTEEFYRYYDLEIFQTRPLWLRNIFRQPESRDNYRWQFWQFANRGHLSGIDTWVDLNVFAGNASTFSRFRCHPPNVSQ